MQVQVSANRDSRAETASKPGFERFKSIMPAGHAEGALDPEGGAFHIVVLVTCSVLGHVGTS